MSNQLFSKEGKGRTDEKVVLVAQESRVESDLPPPPPPFDPSSSSSSSSSLPSILQDPSQPTVRSSSASGDPVAAQIAQLFSLVGRVCSENEALKAQVARLSAQDEAHSASIARLSSENEEFRKRGEEKDKTMVEMTTAFGSHWVWETGRGEGREGKGRWLWSSEKYRPATLQAAEAKAPPSLDSIPVELFNSIASLFGRPEHLALCQVSFNLLGKSSSLIYPRAISLGSKKAASFVSSRNHTPLPPENRISPLLLPSILVLSHSRFNPSHLASLIPPRPTPPIPLDRLLISRSSSFTFVQWSPVLQLLNPSVFQLNDVEPLDPNKLPTTFPVTEEDLFFLRSWTRLRTFVAFGDGSVPVVRNALAFDFAPSIRRGLRPGEKGRVRLESHFLDEEPSSKIEASEQDDLASFLSRPLPPDSMREFVVLVAQWGKEEEEQ